MNGESITYTIMAVWLLIRRCKSERRPNQWAPEKEDMSEHPAYLESTKI
jgi:hypothetical protein